MDINTAIMHAKEVAAQQFAEASQCGTDTNKRLQCLQCSREHDQLAKWLQNYANILTAVKGWQSRELSAIETLKMIVSFIEQQTGGTKQPKKSPNMKIMPKDPEAWKEDMQRDADAYFASEGGDL